MAPTGAQALLDLLAGFGVQYIFGNPGTTELPFTDALAADARLQYILGLQEVPVMAMADGYAMASGQLAVVNLHTACGLGNAMGMLYNAFREGTPLLVTAGQQDRRLRYEEPVIWGDTVEVARPWTKFAYEVQRIDELPRAVRRAAQAALTPPTGPVFLSLPMDLMRESTEDCEVAPVKLADVHIRPPRAALEQAADVLCQARNPIIFAGSRVTEARAEQPLQRLAELLGAPVLSESSSSHGRLAFPSHHPLYAQRLPLWSPQVRQRLQEHDVLLVAGADVLCQYLHLETARPIPSHVRLLHVDQDPRQLGKNYPVEVGVWGHLLPALEGLVDALNARLTEPLRRTLGQRFQLWAERHAADHRAFQEQAQQQRDARPMTPITAMQAIARAAPDDLAVIEEAVTTTGGSLERFGAIRRPDGYFGHRGWALGWGLGCAIGVKLAWPERPVWSILGDGAALYGVTGLWSAAHYQTPVVFIVCNNAQYQVLKIGAHSMGLPQAQQNNFVGMDLGPPEVDFVRLATALGVEAHRVVEPDELTERLNAAGQSSTPLLLELDIDRQTPAAMDE